MKSDPIEISAGWVFECKTLTWNDGWEFECPCLMIEPVIRCWERQMSHEQMVEEVMLDAVVNGKIEDEDFQAIWGWRGYKLQVLRRRWREAIRGKSFPIAQYHAHRSSVKIVRDKRGGLTWEDWPENGE